MMREQCPGYKKEECGQAILADGLCSNCRGAKFEDEVADLFKLMGYTVQLNKHEAGRQADIYFELKHGITTIRGLIECKYHKDSNVSASEVNQALATANPGLMQRKLDKAYLITTKGFASTAKANAEANGIECFTYDQLLDSLIDFKPYLNRMIDRYEASSLYNTYVHLEGDRIKPSTRRGRMLSGKIDFIRNPWRPIGRTLEEYVNRWLALPHSHQICILGDFGSGKTSFCEHFAYECAQRHLRDSVRYPRIPLLIQLSKYARLERGSVQAMITDFLVNECNLQTNYAAFQKFMSDGKLLLVLDGFDEMAMQVDDKTRLRNFEVLAELAQSPNKVVLTGRPGYFPRLEEIKWAMGHKRAAADKYDEVSQEVMERLHRKPNYDILKINPFKPEQISKFLRKQSKRLRENGVTDWRTLRDKIHNIYDLEELAERPVMLEIIVQTIPHLWDEIEEINISKLYQIYTDFWVNREWEKGEMRHLLTSEQRLLFMQELALELYASDRQAIHYTELPQRIQHYFDLDKQSELDYFEHDVRTCAFLNRTDDGDYKFVHKSFMEYFSGRKLLKELSMKKRELFAELDLSDELIDFISGGVAEGDLETLLSWVSAQSISQLNTNAIRVLAASNDNELVGLNLAGVHFEDLRLKDCVFRDCNLELANFEGAMLSNVRFKSCSLRAADFGRADSLVVRFESCLLEKANFRRSTFFNVQFKLCSLGRADFGEAMLSQAQFMSCRLEGANFRYTQFGTKRTRLPSFAGAGSVLFDKSNLKRVNLRGQRLVESSLVNVDLSNANLQNAAFFRCDFRRSKFKRTNLNGARFLECSLNDTHFLHTYMRRTRFLYLKGKGGWLSTWHWWGTEYHRQQEKAYSNTFSGALFEGCNLRQSKFIGQYIHKAILRDSLLSGAKIIGTTFAKSELVHLDLIGANVIGSNCVHSKVEEINLEDASIARSNLAVYSEQ